MSLLTPLGLLAALLAIPIILLYMLRLRRREVRVSSTYLWGQVLRDREANTPWQKLRRNLLLFLQLLILALLALALARPYINVPAVTSGQTALLLDASASMNAQDVNGGTRFAEAQRRANEIIDLMRVGDTMTIIRVADVPEVLTGYTADSAVLHAAVDGAQPSSAPADWTSAFTLAAAGAAGSESFNVVVIGDGGIGAAAGFPPIPGDIEFVPIGTSSDNLAISALAARALPGEPAQLFAQLTNYSDVPVEAIFSLRVDGELVSAERVELSARGGLPFTSDALPDDYQRVEATLTLPADSAFVDALPLDNTAYAVSPGAGARRVLLMSEGNRFFEQVLRSTPGVRTFLASPQTGIPPGDYDITLLDGWLPATLPPGDLFIVNPPSDSAIFRIGDLVEGISGIRVQRGDPRMTFVDFDAVNLLRLRQVFATWAQPLINSDAGPLLLAGESDGRQVAILTFDVRDSDLPLQIAFPILMASLLDWFTPEAIVAEPALGVGAVVALRPPLDAAALRVTLPDGTLREVALGANPSFAETEQPGFYGIEVTRADGVADVASFAINLFAPGESDITPRASITLGQTEITSGGEPELGQQEYWYWLALAAVVVLLIEWYAYHRRQRAPGAFKAVGARGRL
jgi:Ca-activated chloride channel homolog